MSSLPERTDENSSEYLGIRYRILRSMRRTVQLSVGDDGVLTVRMPLFSSVSEAEELIEKHRRWVANRLRQQKEAAVCREKVPKLTEEEMKMMKKAAGARFRERTAYYASLLGVDFGRISLRFQRSRWGSCTRDGNLSFNCLLMLAPDDVLDSVVVHELCHRKEMNHSEAFYREVFRVFPGYKKSRAWLKTYGDELIGRLPK